ncbi:kinesin-like protein KIN-14I [Sesamum indicum]|uniref:Kinesin-like protein KIN-14I n=1 Tax=Sesamum indicum TaxID=4182 RepID=A0A6I9TNA8_SESIN|nr:kinesin-like protein KIN-14I [Sesamum indicum]
MAEGLLQVDVASVVEDVLQQHGKRLSDIDLASRKAEEASSRRCEAAGWLRKMVGVVLGKDLPDQPSEEEFRLGLRSGIILCNALNKVQPGAVTKVVEAPSDTVIVPDGAALSAYQYFENIRNFLDSVGGMGIPVFEASDLEQGGKSSRIVNCVLALKSYNDWKEGGGRGVWKFSGTSKAPSIAKQFVRKNSELFMNSLSRNSSINEKSYDSLSSEQNSCSDLGQDSSETGISNSLHILVRELLSDKKREDIPMVVENMLSKVMEEFELRLARQNDQVRSTLRDMGVPSYNKHEEIEIANIVEEKSWSENGFHDGRSKGDDLNHQGVVEHQQRSIQALKNTLHSTKEDVQMLCMKYQQEIDNLGKHLNGLVSAASGYQKVLEENRKLYNQVQDLKGNIRVYCRIRPFLPGQPTGSSTVEVIDEKTLTVLTPSKYGKGKKSFTFNRVFGPSASQEEVFSDTQPLIRSVLDGYNVCIFAYGQTGSGKTHTMTGPKELTKESIGVNYRALSDLFLISEQRKDSISYDVSVQMIEIYNEQVRDLLATDGVNKRLEIRNNSQNGFNVPSANLVPVTSTTEVLNLMNLGMKHRVVGSTAMNDRSSRSHSCLTVHVQGRDLSSGSILRGCMHLVDLAGSERADKTEAVGDRLKEAQHINRSLSALGDVISSLSQKNSHVPYRNSKLTQLLQDSLGGQAKTLMFIHISPEPNALGETISTLKFAERVSTVELGAARANKESVDVRELKEQIASLKAALMRKERGESGIQQSRSISPDGVIARSSGSSPSHSSCQSLADICKAEGRSNPLTISRVQSFDNQDFMDSPPWPAFSSLGSMEEGDWVDQVIVKKQGGLSGDNNLVKWDEDGRQSPEMFYQKQSLENSKVYPLQSLKKLSDHGRFSLDHSLGSTPYEARAKSEPDHLEAETSDCSEIDYQWQLNVPRSNCMPNGVTAKVQRASPKPIKSPETRSLMPQPRRVTNGMRSPLHKYGRQPASADGKRRPGSLK